MVKVTNEREMLFTVVTVDHNLSKSKIMYLNIALCVFIKTRNILIVTSDIISVFISSHHSLSLSLYSRYVIGISRDNLIFPGNFRLITPHFVYKFLNKLNCARAVSKNYETKPSHGFWKLQLSLEIILSLHNGY